MTIGVNEAQTRQAPIRHELKCWPEYFAAVKSGVKPFEVRKFDRAFNVGDTLLLREYDPATSEYTGNELERTITYLLDLTHLPGESYPHYGGHVVLGLQQPDNPTYRLATVEPPHEMVVRTKEIRERLERDQYTPYEEMKVQDIATLRMDVKRLLKICDSLTAERDAAAKDLKRLSDEFKFCRTCKHDHGNGIDDCHKYDCDMENKYEWRGLCAENAPEV